MKPFATFHCSRLYSVGVVVAGAVSLGGGGGGGGGAGCTGVGMGESDVGWVAVIVIVAGDVDVAGDATCGGGEHGSVCSPSSTAASEISASDTLSCDGGVGVSRDREVKL